MPTYIHLFILALAYADGALSLPEHRIPLKFPAVAPALPTITPHPAVVLKKRQDAGDIVASYGTGSVLSKLHPAQLANVTAAPNQWCDSAADPDEGGAQSCACNGASPTSAPVNSVSGMECAYTVVPGTFSPSTSAAPTPTVLAQPCSVTDTSGVVYSYPSVSLEQAAGFQVTLTNCVGPSTAVSTVSSIAAQASDAAFFENGYCGWASDSEVVIHFGVLIPNWMQTPGFKTANNDFRGSLDGSSACNSFSEYSSALGGPDNTTFGARFMTTDFCTAFDMTKIIKATTGGAFDIPCKKVKKVDLEVHPDSPEVPAGESEPEEEPLEIDPEKRAIIEWLQRV